MRTAKITLDGEERLLCFSTGVLEAACDKFGSAQGFFNALGGENESDRIRTTMWALARMMEAGSRYAERKGIPTAPPLDEEDIRDLCDLSDISMLSAKVQETITNGSQREVEADPPKKGAATSQRRKKSP